MPVSGRGRPKREIIAAACSGFLSTRTGFDIYIPLLLGELLVKSGQLGCVLFPIEMFVGKRDGAGGQAICQFLIPPYLQDGLCDPEGVDLVQNPRFVAVTDKSTQVGPGYNDRPSHCKKLRQLARQTVFIEDIGRARLDENVGQTKQRGNLLVRHLAEFYRHSVSPFFIGTQIGTEVASGANKPRWCSFAVQDCGGEIEAPDFPPVGRVDVACVAKNRGAFRDPEVLQQLGVTRTRIEKTVVRARPEN